METNKTRGLPEPVSLTFVFNQVLDIEKNRFITIRLKIKKWALVCCSSHISEILKAKTTVLMNFSKGIQWKKCIQKVIDLK